MGAQFQIEHANLVAYLTTQRPSRAPHVTPNALRDFLSSLTHPNSLISQTEGTPEDWRAQIIDTAMRVNSAINGTGEGFLSSNDVARYLKPLSEFFTGYDLYCLIIPSPHEESRRAFNLFTEVALTSESRGLVLMPSDAVKSVEFLDPFPALRELAERPIAPPAVLFWSNNGGRCVLPMHEAQGFYRGPLLQALEEKPKGIASLLNAKAKERRAKRILHLSDFHLGRGDSDERRGWLKTHLASVFPSVDKIVITGDLFDNPKRELRIVFDELRADLEGTARQQILVIPGNHDVKSKGNSWWRFGRNSDYVIDLGFKPIAVDDDLHMVFFCFNSNEIGNLARGQIGPTQLRGRALEYEREIARRPHVAEFLKIALVHHHPYAYGSAPTALYERFIAQFFGGEEKFIKLEDADEFMRWCAYRDVSLVLHGHKHVPHWQIASVDSQFGPQDITVVGCGSSTGVDRKPMCYDIVTIDPVSKTCNVAFYQDTRGDGAGFELRHVGIDLSAEPGTDIFPGEPSRKTPRKPQRTTAAPEDDRAILKAIFAENLPDIQDYLGEAEMSVSQVKRDAEGSRPERLYLHLREFPGQVIRDLLLLSLENDYALAIDAAREQANRLAELLHEFNELRWITTAAPTIDMLIDALRQPGDEDLWPDNETAQAEKARKAELVKRIAETYGAEKISDLAADRQYNLDLDGLLKAIRDQAQVTLETIEAASALTRRYELLLVAR